ncbi:succinate--CoA ligase subunit beta [Chloroflexota bacterium]
MRQYEFEGLNLFRGEGIPVPDYTLAASPQEAREKAQEIGLPVVVKAQVLTGGRGLAGGVKTAESLDQVEEVTRHILGLSIRGYPVHNVMVTRKVEVAQEYYLGITIDEYSGTPVAILSTAGGVNIEKTTGAHPKSVVSRHIPTIKGILPDAQQMAREAGLHGEDLVQVATILRNLYSVFCKYDTLVAEINPLVRTLRGTYLALDAKVEIDDSSLYRHPEFQIDRADRISNPLERKGWQIGVTYVELNGDIGIIASGAGLGMATMDIVSRKLRPANFLETGGAITADLMYQAMDLVLQKKGIRAIFINIYGGINPIHEGAKGVVRYIKEHGITIPIVAKALGNYQEETREIFKKAGVTVVTDVSTENGIEQLIHVLEREP